MRVTFVGTWVPRRCGIATFTHDTFAAVVSAAPSVQASVLAIDEPESAREYGSEVVARIRQGNLASYRAAADVANDGDVVNVQHEFGLYGRNDAEGAWEDHLVPFLDRLTVPALVTLHTVLPEPRPWMRDAIRAIARRSSRIVVMAQSAVPLLRDVYEIEQKPLVIPHGVPVVGPSDQEAVKRSLGVGGRTVISTFGLIDPRKGLEYVIQAMPEIAAVDPSAVYLAIGKTHPDLVKRDGEAYRKELVALVERLGMEKHVIFIDEYLPLPQVVEYLQATDVYVTPYLDPNQITSGTLAYALGAGKAIISTRYKHAVEVLRERRGILVDFARPDEIAEAITGLFRDPAERRALEARAYQYGKYTTWPIVGRQIYEAMLALIKGTAGGAGPNSIHQVSSEPAAGDPRVAPAEESLGAHSA